MVTTSALMQSSAADRPRYPGEASDNGRHASGRSLGGPTKRVTSSNDCGALRTLQIEFPRRLRCTDPYETVLLMFECWFVLTERFLGPGF